MLMTNQLAANRALHDAIAEKEILLWRQAVQTHGDSFFEALYTLRASATPDQMADLWITLEMAYHAIEQTPYPLALKEARLILLNAMANALAGFAAALNGNPYAVTRRITRAQSDLADFSLALEDRLF